MDRKRGKQEEAQPKPFDPSSVIRLISRDGCEFIVDRSCALISKTIKAMLTAGNFHEQKEGVIQLPSIDSHLLEKAIQYFYYKHRYDNDPDHRPNFPVPPEIALDLMLVAHYLEM
eukprot:TRINITY_DN2339_c0_g1_i1.p1 TRINITY_DN2339_c0_g1~~TRINITY_DN2339_c0_g1_i1.p1  ORF type:complete len:115 (+),score=10.02 TRINITY_DN2339_c0_g1_i1:87-431(+)